MNYENRVGLYDFSRCIFETSRLCSKGNRAHFVRRRRKCGGGGLVCDVGAGVAHLTIPLAKHGLTVCAVEPNDAMRKNGIKRTAEFPNVTWYEGVGEHTGQSSDKFDLVTFGSSFNVCNREEALEETQRILKPGGWFACLWNHRDLTDKIQTKIEEIIKSYAESYDYGTRREDQTEIIKASGRFTDICSFSERIVHRVQISDIIEGWRSHGTLQRQVGEKFGAVVDDIAAYLRGLGQESVNVPYDTRVYMARVIK